MTFNGCFYFYNILTIIILIIIHAKSASKPTTKEYLIFDIANELDYSPDELINTKVLQMKAIESIKNINTKTK